VGETPSVFPEPRSKEGKRKKEVQRDAGARSGPCHMLTSHKGKRKKRERRPPAVSEFNAKKKNKEEEGVQRREKKEGKNASSH